MASIRIQLFARVPDYGSIGMFVVMLGLLFGVSKRATACGYASICFTFVADGFLGPSADRAGPAQRRSLIGLAAGGTA